ncbi:MAG: urease accessory protein UreD [Burkholderiales bacterium]|jgi:urease accessory protein|nr:urease accessory protein UreD [Burkholderiales bacterium]MCZ8102282.1 urease accessory protein UreD [Burkholderiales bacterium]
MRLEAAQGEAGGPAGAGAAPAPADGSPQLDLAFERGADGRTVLSRRVHRYPFHVTAPLRDGGAASRVVVQSASGGLYGGEHVVQCIVAEEGADALLRFPSATVVHAARATRGTVQRATLVARSGARLAWLPRPAILFPGAYLVQRTEVRVAPGAVVVLTDGAMPHDPRDERGPARSLLAETVVRDLDGRLLALDRQRLDDAMLDAARPGAVGAYRAFGTVWIVGALAADASAACRARIAADVDGRDGVRAGASALPNGCGLVVRIAARDGGALDAALERVAADAERVRR